MSTLAFIDEATMHATEVILVLLEKFGNLMLFALD